MTDDNKISKHLISQFCHDIAGPIGAISNVVELGGISSEVAQKDSDLADDILKKSSLRAVSLLKMYRDIIFVENDIAYEEFVEIIFDYLDLYNISFITENSEQGDKIYQDIARAIGLFCIALCKKSKFISSNDALKLLAEFKLDACVLSVIEYQNLSSLEEDIGEVVDYISKNCEIRTIFSENSVIFIRKRGKVACSLSP